MRNVRFPPVLLLLALTFPAAAAETVTLVRKLPPVVARSGSTVRFEAEIAGNSIPVDTATTLRDKIGTLLMAVKTGEIQIVQGPADTVIKCIITGYEPKTVRMFARQVGSQRQQVATWIGNIEASVQVLDRRQHPIDAANLKNHLEKEFVTSEQREAVSALSDKRKSWQDKLAGGLKTLKGGDAGDVASLLGGGTQMRDALSSGATDTRPPSDFEWRNFLVEGLAAKVANRIVPVDQEFVAPLPLERDFAQIREMAKSGRWGDVQELTEKMPARSGGNEAFRLYMLGLSYEAISYQNPTHPAEAAESLNKASKYYEDAHKIKMGDKEILLAQIRAQDSLDHYLEIEHYQAKPKGKGTEARPGSQQNSGPVEAGPETTAEDNAALIELVKAGTDVSVLITFVQGAPSPHFDVSGSGLLQLMRAKVPSPVIQAVQKRMLTHGANPPGARRPQTGARPIAPPGPLQ